jgi:DNA-binding response OmpR family regulator
MAGRILFVEDDREVRTMVEHTLIAEGYAVDVASTVSDGCALIEDHAYHLVLTDVLLPDGSGAKVADCAAERGFRVLIVTGYAFRIPAADLERHATC